MMKLFFFNYRKLEIFNIDQQLYATLKLDDKAITSQPFLLLLVMQGSQCIIVQYSIRRSPKARHDRGISQPGGENGRGRFWWLRTGKKSATFYSA
jgi:hypothetical protein